MLQRVAKMLSTGFPKPNFQKSKVPKKTTIESALCVPPSLQTNNFNDWNRGVL